MVHSIARTGPLRRSESEVRGNLESISATRRETETYMIALRWVEAPPAGAALPVDRE